MLGLEPGCEQERPVEVVLAARIGLGRNVEGKARRVDRDEAGGVHRVGDADEARPVAGEARQGEAVEAVVEHVLQVGGVEERHLEVLQRELGLRRR